MVHGPGSDTLALKNKLIQNRQMLQEARRRIQMLEDARSNDKERAEMEIAMQVEAVRAEAAVEIRKLKERAKMHEETQKQNNFYMPQGSAVPSFGSSPVGPPSAGSSPERGSPKPAAPEDPRMADRYLALTVEMQQHKLKSKREKNELAKKLEHCFLELRGLKKTRTEMQGEADELKRQLKKSKMDAATRKLAAALADKRGSRPMVDEALTRLFHARMALGLFDDPRTVAYSTLGQDDIFSGPHKAAALEMSEKALVLVRPPRSAPSRRDRTC